MGLDIYFHKFKNKGEFTKYRIVSIIKSDFEKLLDDKYHDILTEKYQRFDDYCMDVDMKLDKGIITNDEWYKMRQNNPFYYTEKDVYTKEECEKLEKLREKVKSINMVLLPSIKMRKDYWFMQWIYNKCKDNLKPGKNSLLTTKDDWSLTMTKDDCFELTSKLELLSHVSGKDVEYLPFYCINDDIGDKYVKKEIVEEVFPIYKNYMWFQRQDYYCLQRNFKYYYENFKKTIQNMAADEIIWVEESW